MSYKLRDKLSWFFGCEIILTLLLGIALYVFPCSNEIQAQIYTVEETKLTKELLKTNETTINIINVTLCDIYGNPKDAVRRGSLAYFKVVLNNTSLEQINILVVINVFDDLSVPIGVAAFQGPIVSGIFEYMFALTISNYAYLGTGKVFANALTDWPHNGGVAYCPQVSSNFQIIS